jgi:hypothetical protein
MNQQELLEFAQLVKNRPELAGQVTATLDEMLGQGEGATALSLGSKLLAQVPPDVPTAAAPEPFNTQAFTDMGVDPAAFGRPIPETSTPIPNQASNPGMAFATGAASGMNFGSNPIVEAELARRKELDPKSATAGKFVGGMVPAVALEYAYSKIPGGKLINKMLPGNSFERTALRQTLKDQAPVAAAAAAGGTYGALDPEQSALTGAALGAGGAKLGQMAGGMLFGRESLQPEATVDLIKKQQQKGYWANPGLQSARRQERQLDEALRKAPGTAQRIQNRLDHNQDRFNSEVADAIGLPKTTTSLDVDTLQRRNSELTDNLNKFYEDIELGFTINPELRGRQVVNSYEQSTGNPPPQELKNFVARYEGLVGAGAPKSAYAQRALGNKTRTLVKDLSKRMTWHYTHPNGDEFLGRQYQRLYDDIQGAVEKGLGKTARKEWQQTREQQALLIDLIENDRSLTTEGKVSPKAVLGMFDRARGRKLSYVNRRRDLFDSARFLDMQRNSFESSLAMSQRFANVINPKHRTTTAGIFSDLTKDLPGIRAAPIEKYLRSNVRRNNAGVDAMGLLGGGAAITGYDFSQGLLD